MATSYDEIFLSFKDNITDSDILLLSEELQTETMIALMKKAINRCGRICNGVDLSDRDDELLTFNVDVPDDFIEIITEWMTVFWLKPYLNNTENFRNILNTKDFSFFSPANLLEKISNTYKNTYKHARSLTNEYSYIHADMTRLT
ncbi:MAG: hypothetical protein KBT35_05850 [Firmicutes bacterium]|nr:hypothetical protein [Candidatus Colivicinus equi]